ncbi:MAG: flagellar hook-basal body complex protein [Phycisphaerales bacterium]|nr:flagellar hook-basal body complex protein [Phycisphaerales bacterium]
MNYGLYLSANGISCSQHKMNVLANNLANVNTTGFKQSQVVLGERAREPQHATFGTDGRKLLEQLGGGTQIGYTGPTLSQGSIETTNMKTDLALMGEGFLRLQGDTKGEHTLTRDGRLRFDGQGTLLHATSGLPVLDDRGRSITLDGDQQLRFAGFGSNGELLDRDDLNNPFARIGLVDGQKNALRPEGRNLFVSSQSVTPSASTEVIGGALETSNADPVTSMVELIKLTREIEMNSRMIQYQDAMIGQAVTSLGRVV